VVSLQPTCGDPDELVALVRNIGEAVLPAGVRVRVSAVAAGTTTPLAQGTTSHPLYSAQAEQVKLPIPATAAAAAKAAESFTVEIEVDAKWHECRTDNNSVTVRHASCGVIL
jgi:hypothetical protein